MSRAEWSIWCKVVLVPTMRQEDFSLPPLANLLVTRDTTCWIYVAVTLNPMRWPARQQETVNIAAIYRFHPDFRDAGFPVWWGDPDSNFGQAMAEGGDVMPIGNSTMLVGMGEIGRAHVRTTVTNAQIVCRLPPE